MKDKAQFIAKWTKMSTLRCGRKSPSLWWPVRVVVQRLLIIVIITVGMMVTMGCLVLLIAAGIPGQEEFLWSRKWTKNKNRVWDDSKTRAVVVPVSWQHAVIFIKLFSTVVLPRVAVFVKIFLATNSGLAPDAATRPVQKVRGYEKNTLSITVQAKGNTTMQGYANLHRGFEAASMSLSTNKYRFFNRISALVFKCYVQTKKV